MSREIFEATIRNFISVGSGIAGRKVIEAWGGASAPDGLYASVGFISERRLNRPVKFPIVGASASHTLTVACVESMFSVQLYRAGALAAAQTLIDWMSSDTGLGWAATAMVDGRVAGVNVYNGGSGYTTGDLSAFEPDEFSATTIATGSIQANDRGEATGILMTNTGSGYWNIPIVHTSGGTGATATARGYGFSVCHPINLRNITDMISGDYEERAQFDLRVQHDRVFDDLTSGRIEEIKNDSTY